MKRDSSTLTIRHIRWWAVVALVMASASTKVHAEDAAATATKVFDEGRQLLEEGQIAQACAKFAESQKLDARVGTLLNLALCHEKRAMLVEASDHWRQAEQLAVRVEDDRAQVARKRAQQMEPQIPLLTITLARGAPSGTTVSWADSFMDHPKPLAEADMGKPLRVNAGTVRITVEAPKRKARSFVVAVALHDRKSVEVAVGAVVGRAPTGAPGEGADDGAGSDAGTALAVTGIVLGGLGLVGIGVGATFGGIADAKNSESNEIDPVTGRAPCNADDLCNDAGLALRDDAIAAATGSTVSVAVGSALLATGIVLVLVGQSDDDEAAGGAQAAAVDLIVSPLGGGLRGRW